MLTKLNNLLQTQFQKNIDSCTNEEMYIALLLLVKSLSKNRVAIATKRKLYYISAEFLIGKLLSNNLINLGIYSENLKRLHNELSTKDWFMTLLDLKSYIQTKDTAFEDYTDRHNWAKKSLINIAKAGYFSSDRTIAEYNRDIWKLN